MHQSRFHHLQFTWKNVLDELVLIIAVYSDPELRCQHLQCRRIQSLIFSKFYHFLWVELIRNFYG